MAATGTQAAELTLVCSHCGGVVTVPIEAEVEANVRHDRDATIVVVQPDAQALHAAVAQHVARGCKTPHLMVMPPEPEVVERDPDDDGRWLIA